MAGRSAFGGARGRMDRNNDGQLALHEREEFEALVELSETMALVRAQALSLLGRFR
jgi:hypothetical protein